MAKYLNRYFTREYVQMASQYMKRCPTPSIFREMQIKATIDTTAHLLFCLTLKTSVCEYVKQQELTHPAGASVKGENSFAKQVGVSLKVKLDNVVTSHLAFYTYPRGNKVYVQTNTCIQHP